METRSSNLLTRQQYMSHSGLQAGAGTRRRAQARVVPLPSTGTQGRCLPEAPNPMIFNDRPRRAGPQAALPHLAVEWLQRRWAALLRTGTPRLNTKYIVAGLIVLAVALLLSGVSACSTETTAGTQRSSGMTNPCAMKHNPCAMKHNPCAVGEKPMVDPHRITRPADIELFRRAPRSVLVAEGKMLFEDSSLSSNGSSCNSCHATDNLFNATFATPYPHPVAMAAEKAGLNRALQADEFVQFCMIVPMASKPLPWDSRELAALTAYVVDVRQKAFMAASRKNPCSMKNPRGMPH